MPGFTFLRHAPSQLETLLASARFSSATVLIGGELNRLRSQLGLETTRRILGNCSRRSLCSNVPGVVWPPQADCRRSYGSSDSQCSTASNEPSCPRSSSSFCGAGPLQSPHFRTGMSTQPLSFGRPGTCRARRSPWRFPDEVS